ncbi:MAG: hypothetical protein ABEJ55_07815 [Halanaeroarchaeum sp.]
MESPLPGSFIENGAIQYGALFGALLGAAWLVLVGGLITIQNAIVTLHIQLIRAAQTQIVRLIDAVLGGGAELTHSSWAIAYESAVETAPLFAPALMALEVVAVWLILGTIWDRQEVI